MSEKKKTEGGMDQVTEKKLKKDTVKKAAQKKDAKAAKVVKFRKKEKPETTVTDDSAPQVAEEVLAVEAGVEPSHADDVKIDVPPEGTKIKVKCLNCGAANPPVKTEKDTVSVKRKCWRCGHIGRVTVEPSGEVKYETLTAGGEVEQAKRGRKAKGAGTKLDEAAAPRSWVDEFTPPDREASADEKAFGVASTDKDGHTWWLTQQHTLTAKPERALRITKEGAEKIVEKIGQSADWSGMGSDWRVMQMQ